MTLEAQFWTQGNIFACNAGKKANSLKTAWIETSEVLCFGLLPLLLKSGTSPIVLDFNRVRTMLKSFKKIPPTIFSAWFYQARRFWCWKASWHFVTPRGGLPDFFMLALSLQGVLESLPDTVRAVLQLTHWYCLLLIPPWQNVRRDMWKKGRNSITSSSCSGCRSTGMDGSVPCSFVLSSSFLMCTTVVPSCSRSCAWAFSRKVSHAVLASVLMAGFLRTNLLCLLLLTMWQTTASGLSSLSYGWVFFCYSKYGFVFKGFSYHTSS